MPYGALAYTPGPERFEPGAFGDVRRADVILNRQHFRHIPLARTGSGGLSLIDSPAALRMRAALPETREASDALTLVRAGVLRGLSVEFIAHDETYQDGVRVIRGATLRNIGLVDRPAYAGATPEVRRRGGGLSGSFRYGRTKTRSDRGRNRKVKVRSGAFRYSLKDKRRDVTLQVGSDPGKILASRRAGSLTLTDTDSALSFEVGALPDTTYVRDLRAQIAAGFRIGVEPLYKIPPPAVVPGAVKLIPEAGNPAVLIEEVRDATLFGLSIRARPGYPEPNVATRAGGVWWL